MRTMSRSIARSLHRSIARVSGGAWSPLNLPTALQSFDGLGYAASTVGGFPVLSSQIGTLARPRGQRCALFDGVDDYATGANPLLGYQGDFTLCAWTSLSAAANFPTVFSGSNAQTELRYEGSSRRLNIVSAAGVVLDLVSPNAQALNTPTHIAATYDATAKVFRLYENGVLAATSAAGTGTFPTHATNIELGMRGGYLVLDGRIWDARVYTSLKTAAQLLAIYNQHLTPTTLDRTSLVAGWWLNEESGTTHYDWSGNARNLTATNITQGTYHATDAGVKYNAANFLGHTVSGSVIIPRNEAVPAQDAAGNAIGITGPVMRPAVVEVPCVTFDGTTMECDLGHKVIPESGDFNVEFLIQPKAGSFASFAVLIAQTDGSAWTSGFAIFFNAGTASWRVYYGNYLVNFIDIALTTDAWNKLLLRKVGTTMYASVNSGSETSFTSAASITSTTNTQLGTGVGGVKTNCAVAGLSVSNGKTFPMQDGPGTSNTNRDLAWVGSDGTGGVISGAIVNGTVATIWGTRTANAEDWSIKNGGGIAANGAYIAGRIGSGNDAAGTAKTLAAGDHRNPYSRFVPNPFSAPELVNIGSTSADLYAPDGMAAVQVESVADTRYANNKRYAAFSAALTGTDKTNAEAWEA